jgi:hypothetical protein
VSGIHIVGDSGRFDSLLQTWARNGLQCVLQVKPEGSNGARLRELLPNGFLVGRITNNTTLTDSAIQQAYEANPKAAAAWIWGIYQPTISTQPQYNAWQFNNEPVFGSGETRLFRIRRLCEFTKEIIDLANAQGHGVALFNFARGTPELDEWVHFYEVWRYALAKNTTIPPGRKNILSLHQYGAFGVRGAGALFHEEAWHLKRYETQIRPRLPADLKAAEYFINESGPDGGQDDIRGWIDVYGRNDAGRAACVMDWRIYNNEFLANQPGCKGAAFFTLGQEGGFGTFDIANDPIAGMLAGVQYRQMKPAATTTPPQPQPTPPPPTGGFMIDRRYMGRAGIGENYEPRPAGVGVDGVILHHTGGGFLGSLNHLTSATSGVGAHYLIDYDGKIYQLIEDTYAAWHAGYSILNGREDCNRYTLGVEIVNAGDGREPYPQIQQDALVWLLKEKAREHQIPRMWVDTHQKVRANYKAKYPTATNPDGSPISHKTDPRGLDVSAILNRVYGTPDNPPPLPYTDEERAKAKWFTEQLARTLRGDTDATATLISALISEPKKAGLHNALVAKAVPSLEKVTT